jgi:ATP-binding cassette subfamily B protein
MANNKLSHVQLLKRVALQVRSLWLHIAGIFFIGLLSTPIALLKPYAMKLVIDNAFGNQPLPAFIRFPFPGQYNFTFTTIIIIAAAMVILVAFLENILSLATWILGTFAGEKMVLDFKTRLFNHIQRLSLAYHDNIGTSDSLYRIQWDTMGIRTLLLSNFTPLISSIITLIAMIWVMFTINTKFALIAVCIIPPLFFLIRYSTSKLKKHWEVVKDQESRAMSVLHEVLNSLRVVKAFGQETGEEERFISQSGHAIKGQIKVAWISALFYFAVGMIFAAGTAIFIILGARYVQRGEMTLGELTLIIAYLTQFFGPLQNISKNITDIQSSIASIERVFKLLDKEQEVKESANPIPIVSTKGNFRFENVAFEYSQSAKILYDLSFEIKPGTRVGIIGSTGAGKSTLISLLMRFYDPTSGNIFLDGYNVKDLKLADYRSQFSIVLQEPVLFSTSIGENIRYGKPGASDKEILEAARAANAHDFIVSGKDGYDSLVGERGMQLSGGERQRISIARAFIKNAPILILDEPTSSLDIKTESQIMEAMERLMEGRTTFMITHRLDTLKTCDVIIHLEKGRLIDVVKNTEESLARKKNIFLQKL